MTQEQVHCPSFPSGACQKRWPNALLWFAVPSGEIQLWLTVLLDDWRMRPCVIANPRMFNSVKYEKRWYQFDEQFQILPTTSKHENLWIYMFKGSLAQKLPIYERHLSKVKSSRVESSRVESSRVESSRVESSRVESSRVVSSRVESSRVESSRVGQVE